jgi:hypothetical protein
MPASAGLNRQQWEEKLAQLGAQLQALNGAVRLEIIGPWPLIEAGMPGRTSLDLDVWAPGSQSDRRLLRAACAAAGLDFDPLDETDLNEYPISRRRVPGIR